MDRKVFASPPAQYRPLPFWAWNDQLEPKRIREQVRHMHKIGFGGFFMHSRQGLVTPYLGEEWMAAVKAAIDEAEKLDMEAWLYDEDRYPSGSAGGKALEPNPSGFAAKHLIHVDAAENCQLPGTRLARFAYIRLDKGQIHIRRLSETEAPDQNERFLGFSWDTAPPSGWFNGFTYIDTLDPDAVQSFIVHGLDPYKQFFAKEFGGRIPGLFSDEPQMFSVRTDTDTSTWPWTLRFPYEFKTRRGYNLLDHLPALVLSVPNYRQVRYDFWKTAVELFLETWCQLISQWCEKNNLKWTGHYWEHEFPYFHKTGSFMAPVAYFHIPGIDLLGSRKNIGKMPDNTIQPQMGNVQMVKLASSVAHQTGKQRLLSETYGGAGSDMTFLDQKIMADWEIALGVNVINPHLYHYSLRGLRKRDYPPSWGVHQPWSHEYRPLADYLSRLSYALSDGEYLANIAVLHPTTVFWVEGFNQKNIARSFEDLCKDLTEHNWDYDLADETLLETLGRVDGDRLRVGQAVYDILILPSGMILAPSTVALVVELIRNGGTVLVLEQRPQAVCHDDQMLLDSLFDQIPVTTNWEQLESQLRAKISKMIDINISDEARYSTSKRPRIYSQVRRTEVGYLVFLANVGEADCANAEITIGHPGPVVSPNPHDGKIYPVLSSSDGSKTRLQLRFLQGDSYLLLLGDKIESWCDPTLPPINKSQLSDAKPVIFKDWTVSPLNSNSLVLDCCSYRINCENWSPMIPVWDAHCQIRARYGLTTSLTNSDVQPWRRQQERNPLTTEEPIEVRLSFIAKNLQRRKSPVKLAVECGQHYKVTVNGKQAEAIPGYWLDPAFSIFDITNSLVENENTIVLTTTFNEELELENCFILGEFTVTAQAIGEPSIIDFQATDLSLGDWTNQGYPFFAGRIAYTTSFHHNSESTGAVLLEIGTFKVHAVTVYVNDIEAGKIIFPPYQIDITKWLQPGENTLKLVATNSLRNLTDPLHHLEIKSITGPESFADRNNWQNTYNLAVQGIDDIRIVRTR